MTLTVKDILIEARAKIDTPEKWTKGAFARVAPQGNKIGPQEANAKCWCLQGAIRSTNIGFPLWEKANEALGQSLPAGWAGHGTHVFNDDPATKHEDVLALFDRAIAAQPA